MSKIALLAGYRITGGLRNSLAELRGHSFIVGENIGIMVITPLGVAHCEKSGIVSPVPTDRAGLVKFWANHSSFEQAARKCFAVLSESGQELTMQEIADRAGYQITGGLRNALGDLRTAGVIVGKNTDRMKLNPEVFG